MMPDINCKWYIFDFSSLVLHEHQCNHLWFSKLACSPGGSVWLNLVFITPNLRDKYNSWKLIKVFHLFSDILMCFNKHFDIYHECISLELLFFDVIYLAIMPIIHTNKNKCHLFLTWSLYCKYLTSLLPRYHVPPLYRMSWCSWCEAGTGGAGPVRKELCLGSKSDFAPSPAPPPLF